MSLRKFKRMMKYEGSVYGDFEQTMRQCFEKVLAQAIAQMQELNAASDPRPFTAWGEMQAPNGQRFKLSIECSPPTLPMNPDNN